MEKSFRTFVRPFQVFGHTISLIFISLMFTACGRDFSQTLESAQKSFDEKNFVGVIDTVNNGLPAWKESDGNEKKGRAYELLGRAYHQLRNSDKAIDAYTQAVKLSDKAYDAAYGLGNLHLARGQALLAEKSFLDALRIKPNDPLSYLGLGNSYFAQKKNTEATIAFQKVLDISPGVREAQESLNALKRPSVHSGPKLIIRNKATTKKKLQLKKRL
jgi:tetratricopeptide (TPR) repeat protein